jgi:hypothetical protein
MKKWLALAAGVIAAGSVLLALTFTGNLAAALPGPENDAAAGENETKVKVTGRL